MKGEHLKYFGAVLVGLGLVAFIPLGMRLDSVLIAVGMLVFSCLTGVFFIGFGELVQSVQRIERRVAGERPQYDPLTGQYEVPRKDSSR